MVQCFSQLGRFQEGLFWGHEGIRIAGEATHAYSLAYANCSVGLLLTIRGEIDSAIRKLEETFQQCQKAEIRVLFPQIASYLGLAYALAKRFDEATHLMERAEEETGRIGRKAGQALRVAWHGFANLLAGRIEEATDKAERAVQLAGEQNERGHQAWALLLMGDIAAGKAKVGTEKALEYYNLSLALANELKMNPLQAHAHLGLGNVYLKAQEIEHARMEWSEAAKLYESMNMTYWLKLTNNRLARAV